MTPHARRMFFSRLRELNPHPTTELRYGNTYQLLVAVVLSAQATDAGVNAATESIFREIETPAQMLALGESAFAERIRTIGLWRAKARNVIGLSRLLEERHSGAVPCDREELESLPGVGRKTANVILNTAYGEETIAVDTHIFRLSNRTGLAPAPTVEKVEQKLLKSGPSPVPPPCSSLANPAWSSHMQVPPPLMCPMPRPPLVRLPSKIHYLKKPCRSQEPTPCRSQAPLGNASREAPLRASPPKTNPKSCANPKKCEAELRPNAFPSRAWERRKNGRQLNFRKPAHSAEVVA